MKLINKVNKVNKSRRGLSLVEFLAAIGIGGALIAIALILGDLIVN